MGIDSVEELDAIFDDVVDFFCLVDYVSLTSGSEDDDHAKATLSTSLPFATTDADGVKFVVGETQR